MYLRVLYGLRTNSDSLALYPRRSVLTARSELIIWIQFTFTFVVKFCVYE